MSAQGSGTMLRFIGPSLFFYILFFLLFTPLGISKEPAQCLKTPEAYISKGLKTESLSVCRESANNKVLFCQGEPTQTGFVCSRPSLPQQLKQTHLARRTWSQKERDMLAAYTSVLPNDRLKVTSNFSIQTGQYGHLSFSPSKKSPCWKTIVRSAYDLHRNFPNITFVLSDRIRNCKALKRGTDLMVRKKSQVLRNLNSFSTPLHSVYLTNESKFNHYVVGKMGLYVNVNQRGEMAKRLVEFKIGRNQIPHETRSGRIGGMFR